MSLNHSDLIILTKQLSVMLKAGIPIESAVASLQNSTSNTRLKNVYLRLHNHLSSGHTLSDSLALFPQHFETVFRTIIQIGEKTGTLDKVLSQLVVDIDKLHRLRQKIRAALTYPIIVVGVMLTTTILLSLFVLPKLVDFFSTFDQTLPLPTRILISLSIYARDYGLLTIAVISMLSFGLFILAHYRSPKLVLDRLLVKIPYLGSFIVQSQTANLARNLSLMLKSGMPLTLALFTLHTTITNLFVASQVELLLDGITAGRSLTTTLTKNPTIFPPLFLKMVEVGEKTGTLPELLSDTADFFENEVDNIAKNSTTVIEPILLLIIGLLVGFMALAIISPIYQLTGSIGQ